jgi:hypothetical protein
MKELETHLKINDSERVELNVKKKKEVQHSLMGTIKPKIGHFIWELNEETGVIKKAEYKRDTTVIFGANIPTEELIINPDCIYIPSLNAKNAKKKYLKNKEQSSYFFKAPEMDITHLKF